MIARGLLLAIAIALGAGGAAEAFERGINVNPWFTKPRAQKPGSKPVVFADPAYPAYTAESYRADLEKIAAAGFDFIRVPISPGPFLPMDPDKRRAAFANIRTVLETARAQGLDIMLNIHAGSTVSYAAIAADEGLREQYIASLLDLIAVMGDLGFEHVLFETINEPSSVCDDPVWPIFQRQILEAVAAASDEARMVVTGSCWSAIDGFVLLDPAELPLDPERLYYTFHYYSPYVFTHQGNSWSGDPGNRVVTGLAWPAARGDLESARARILEVAPKTEGYARFGEAATRQALDLADRYYASNAGPDFIATDFDRVADWARAHDIPADRIILSEFGVLKRERKWQGADIDSAARWVGAVRQAAEARGMPWAMWSYDEGMALTVADRDIRWHGELVEALGLKSPEAEPIP
ncbi:glycoside hydrolase family 5 protein [Amaricoccus solimangrovi]|nr:cellulase family glycosylhydrolase [Amaricoccus solimangrovi]